MANERFLVRNMNSSIYFDGSNDHVSNTSISGFPNTNSTISFAIWIKYPPITATTAQIFAILDNSNNGVSLEFRSSTFQVQKGSGSGLVATASNPTPHTWHHIVYTGNGTTNSLYVDGLLNNTSSTTPTNTTVTKVRVSTFNGTSEPYQGYATEAYIWNVTLTAAQVAALYYRGIAPSGQILAWKMNEGNGTTATDTSGSGFNGTLTNGPLWSKDVPIGGYLI